MRQLLRPVRRVGVEEQAVAGLQRIELVGVAINDLAFEHVDELQPACWKIGKTSDSSVSVIR